MAVLDRCFCGRMPRLRARPTREDTIITTVVCPNLNCEAEGPAIEDFERNDEAAAALWNRHGGRKATPLPGRQGHMIIDEFAFNETTVGPQKVAL